MDINLDDIPYVIYSCFVLHSYCEAQKDTLPHEISVQQLLAIDNFNHQHKNLNFRMETNETEGRPFEELYHSPLSHRTFCIIM